MRRWRSQRISSNSRSDADVVICAASLASSSLLLGRIAPEAIICDAGYPKNLHPTAHMPWRQRSSSADWDRSRVD